MYQKKTSKTKQYICKQIYYAFLFFVFKHKFNKQNKKEKTKPSPKCIFMKFNKFFTFQTVNH